MTSLLAELKKYKTYEALTSKVRELDAEDRNGTISEDDRALYVNLLITGEDKGYLKLDRHDNIRYSRD